MFIQQNIVHCPSVDSHTDRNFPQIPAFFKSLLDLVKQSVCVPAQGAVLVLHTVWKPVDPRQASAFRFPEYLRYAFRWKPRCPLPKNISSLSLPPDQSKWNTSWRSLLTGLLSGFVSMMSAIKSHHFRLICVSAPWFHFSSSSISMYPYKTLVSGSR